MSPCSGRDPTSKEQAERARRRTPDTLPCFTSPLTRVPAHTSHIPHTKREKSVKFKFLSKSLRNLPLYRGRNKTRREYRSRSHHCLIVQLYSTHISHVCCLSHASLPFFPVSVSLNFYIVITRNHCGLIL